MASTARSASATRSSAHSGRRRRRSGRPRPSVHREGVGAGKLQLPSIRVRGYYSYTEGYTPEFPGVRRFAGRIVHPQKWTDDIDYAARLAGAARAARPRPVRLSLPQAPARWAHRTAPHAAGTDRPAGSMSYPASGPIVPMGIDGKASAARRRRADARVTTMS